MNEFHQPVMVSEVLDQIKLKPGYKVIDCTLGGGGHVIEYFKHILPGGGVLGIDLDPLAIARAKQVATLHSQSLIVVRDNFKNVRRIAHEHGFNRVQAIVFDLGLSSGQLRDQRRGFSFLAEGSLDMRFGEQTTETAAEILQRYSETELVNIFETFGEERLAKPIARKIVAVRKHNPITTPKQLLDIIVEIYQKYFHGTSKINPATKVFQSLRIVVNGELDNLIAALPQAVDLLEPAGRLAIISYHSLEDRIVKDFFKQESRDCICSADTPVCVCGHRRTLRILTKKPILPSDEELALNPRARSAKLRVAEKIIS